MSRMCNLVAFWQRGEREQEFEHFAVWLHRPSKPSGLAADGLRPDTSLQNSLRTNRESSWWAACRGGHFRADMLLLWLSWGACSHEQDAVKPVGWFSCAKIRGQCRLLVAMARAEWVGLVRAHAYSAQSFSEI